MRKLVFIVFFFGLLASAQRVDRFTHFATSSVTYDEHYALRAGAADPTSATSIAGWVGGNAGTFESSIEQARSGTTSIKIVSSDGTSQFKYFDFSSAANGDLPDIVAGDAITINGWVYAPTGATVRVLINSTDLGTQTLTFTPDTWTEFTYTMTATGSGNFYLYTTATDYTYFDDIRIYSPQ